MAAILHLCKLGMMKGFNAKTIVISVLLVPENMGLDTKIKSLQVSNDKIQVKIAYKWRPFWIYAN